MSNRIGSQPPPQTATTTSIDPATTPATTSAPPPAAQTAPPYTGDVWESGSQDTPFLEYGPMPPPKEASTQELPEPFRAWERRDLCGTGTANQADAAQKTDAGKTADARAERPQRDVADHPVAKRFVAFLEMNNGGRLDSLNSYLNGHVYDKMSASERNSMVELLDDKAALRELFINSPGGSASAADKLIANIENRITAQVGAAIEQEMFSQIAAVKTTYASINFDSQTRLEFLDVLATCGGDSAAMARGLENIGIESSDAKSLAEAYFKEAGKAQPDFSALDRELGARLTRLETEVETFRKTVGNDVIRQDRFLTDPNIELVRKAVLEKMGAVLEPADQVNGLGRLINEKTAASRKTQNNEKYVIGAISIGTAIATMGIGGVGAGVAMGVAGALPGVGVAFHEVGRATSGLVVESGDAANVRRARSERNKAVALAVLNVGLGAGATAASGRIADVTLQNTVSKYASPAISVAIDGGTMLYDTLSD